MTSPLQMINLDEDLFYFHYIFWSSFDDNRYLIEKKNY